MQDLIVALLVGSATLYAVWRLAPAVLRRQAARRLAGLATRSGASAGTARRIEQRVATASGCGSCDRCKGCASGTRSPAP